MKKKIIAIIVGVFTVGAVVAGLEMLGHSIYPPPKGLSADDPEGIAAYLKVIPIGALLIVVAGWLLGALLGGFVSSKICPENWRTGSLVIGITTICLVLMNIIEIPHPLWMKIVGLSLPLLFAYIGGVLAVGRRPQT